MRIKVDNNKLVLLFDSGSFKTVPLLDCFIDFDDENEKVNFFGSKEMDTIQDSKICVDWKNVEGINDYSEFKEFIKNNEINSGQALPDGIVIDAEYVHTENNYSNEEKQKVFDSLTEVNTANIINESVPEEKLSIALQTKINGYATIPNYFLSSAPGFIEDAQVRRAVKYINILDVDPTLLYSIFIIYRNKVDEGINDRLLVKTFDLSGTLVSLYILNKNIDASGTKTVIFNNYNLYSETFILTIDYEEITDDGSTSGMTNMIVNPIYYDNKIKLNNPTESVNSLGINELIYGANIQGVLSKLMAYKTGMLGGKPIRINVLGDSITGGIHMELWKAWMETEYELPTDAIEIHWYGGYAIETMMPFIDNLIADNPDLFIYNEYENYGNTLTHLESIIQLLRKYTTADIAIGTWSISPAELRLRIANSYGGTGNSNAMDYNRSLARKYNCELIDFSRSVINYTNLQILNGTPLETVITDLYGVGNESVHLSSDGYTLTMFPEFKKHFGRLNENNNMPYVINKEEKILFADSIIYDNLNNKDLTIDPSFILAANNIYTTTADAELVIPIKDAIGFELFLEDAGTGNVDITVKKEGESSFVAPSTLRNNTYPLQFATEIVSITYATNADQWRMKRPFMKCVVTDNILANGVLKSGQYKIVVTDVTLDEDLHQVVTCIVKNPAGVQIGDEFIVGESNVTIGNLYFPLKWNGSNNWIIDDSSTDNWGVPANGNYTEGDEYEFYIKSNWIDTFDKTNVYQRVFGFERGNYDVKLKNVSGAFWIHSLNILK
ncbi:MAG: SGNH/GDSL hydrolase family protein [Bacteroidetes bacterium]|nr:SGNH/GDSL hydrolase family protein [Bacteroidota bacterium]